MWQSTLYQIEECPSEKLRIGTSIANITDTHQTNLAFKGILLSLSSRSDALEIDRKELSSYRRLSFFWLGCQRDTSSIIVPSPSALTHLDAVSIVAQVLRAPLLVLAETKPLPVEASTYIVDPSATTLTFFIAPASASARRTFASTALYHWLLNKRQIWYKRVTFATY